MLRKPSNLSQLVQRERLQQEFQPLPGWSVCDGDEDQPVGFSISSAAANDRVCSWRFLQRVYNILWSSTLFLTIYKFFVGRMPQFLLRRDPGFQEIIFLFSTPWRNRSPDIFRKCVRKSRGGSSYN